MRKTLLLFIFLCGLAMSGRAADRFVYGYCAETISDGVGPDGTATLYDVSAALYIPAESLKPFAGCQLTAVRAGLYSFMASASNLRVFVTHELGGAPLTETTAETIDWKFLTHAGYWNEVALETPYTVPADVTEGIYVGYTINANLRPIGVDGVASPNANGCWYGDAEGWTQLSGFGCMAVQTVFSGAVPQCNVALSRVAHPDYVKPGKDFVLAGVLQNNASEPVTSFDLTCTANGKTTVYAVSGLNLAQRDSARFTVRNVQLPDSGSYDVRLEITNINGGTMVDYDMTDNDYTFAVQASDRFVTRTVLAENNTTSSCPNCPYGHIVLDSLFTPRADSVIWVCNHAGYYTDTYTIGEGSTLFSTFIDPIYTNMAPGLMLDRSQMSVFGAMIQASTGEAYRPIFAVNTCEHIIDNMLDFELAEASPLTLSMSQSYEADSSALLVTIQSDLLGKLRNYNTTLNIFLLEDGLMSSQMGAEGSYTNNNVLRYVYGSAGGVQIAYTDNHFEGTFALPIKTGWNMSKMKVVAFVSDYGELNPIAYRVYNAISQKMALTRAEPATYVLSYCSDDITEGTTLRSIAGIEAAAVFPAATMAQWKGARVTKLRLGMAEVLTNAKLWVRTSYNGETLVEQAVVNPQLGWNEVELATPLVLDGSEIAIGFSCDDQTVTPGIGGSSCANAFWIKIGTLWLDLSANDRGRLSIQAVIESDGVELYDVDVLDVLPGQSLYSQAEEAEFCTVVKNRSGLAVSSFDLNYYLADQWVGMEHVVRSIASQATDTIVSTLTFPLTDCVGNAVPIRVVLSNLDGGTVESSTDNNEAAGTMAVYDRDYPLTHLVEHFTTQACTNCPSGSTALNAAIARTGEKVVSIAHHVGYNTDVFTVSQSNSFLSMFGGSTYAPAAMADRLPLPTSYNIYGSGSIPVFCLTVGSGVAAFTEYVEGALKTAFAQHTKAYANLSISASYDEATRALKITVTGEKAKYLDYVMTDPRLSVFVTEDSIVAYQSGHGPDYVHNHVIRSFAAGEAWGVAPTWNDDNTFTYVATVTLDASWVLSNLHLVACIGNYASSISDRTIMNVTQVDLKTATGIAEVAADADRCRLSVVGGKIVSSAAQLQVYGLTGAEEENEALAPGVHLVKATMTDGSVRMAKVVVK